MTEIKQFFAYTQSEESISLKQVEKLRKKAFYTYAMHNDCQSLEVVPIEINKIFEKIHNGHQQQISDNVIKKSFLQYAEKILLDRNEVAKISSIRTAVIIEDLTTASIPFVKEGLIHQHKLDGELLRLQAIVMEHKKDCLLIPADSDQQTEAIYIFSENDRKYLGNLKRKYKKRISHHQRKADEIEGIRKNTTQDIIRKKYTGDSETWLKQHLVANQSLYQLIKEIVKKNKQRSHLKNKNL